MINKMQAAKQHVSVWLSVFKISKDHQHKSGQCMLYLLCKSHALMPSSLGSETYAEGSL